MFTQFKLKKVVKLLKYVTNFNFKQLSVNIPRLFYQNIIKGGK